MNNQEYLINQAMEEAAELVTVLGSFIRACSKCQRFGLNHALEASEPTNREKLQEEVNDLLCALSYLAQAGIIEIEAFTPRFNKGKKREAMIALSRELGCLQDDKE